MEVTMKPGQPATVRDKKSRPTTPAKHEPAVPRHTPTARECALLLLRLIQAKEEDSGKALSRFRVAEISLKRIWGRHRITPDFVDDVNGWLLYAGRVVFYAGGSYGVILVSAVESWSRLASKRIAPEIEQALAGTCDFTTLEGLLVVKEEVGEDDS
jgi:hypothetical protein